MSSQRWIRPSDVNAAAKRTLLAAVAGRLRVCRLALIVATLAAAALALLAGPDSSRSSTKDGDPYHAPGAVDTNASPKIFETTITAQPATVDIGQGVKARALTFNGSIPGPTLRLDVGDRVIVHFRNQLDEETGIHWHGVEVPNPIDGTPLTQDQVKPGARSATSSRSRGRASTGTTRTTTARTTRCSRGCTA